MMEKLLPLIPIYRLMLPQLFGLPEFRRRDGLKGRSVELNEVNHYQVGRLSHILRLEILHP